jgi:hypothetical protein
MDVDGFWDMMIAALHRADGASPLNNGNIELRTKQR